MLCNRHGRHNRLLQLLPQVKPNNHNRRGTNLSNNPSNNGELNLPLKPAAQHSNHGRHNKHKEHKHNNHPSNRQIKDLVLE
jgi:hypothetical protein